MADAGPSNPPSTATTAQAPTPANPRNIPAFPFMSSVSSYISSPADVEPTLRSFQEMLSKYQFMEANLMKRAQSLREKLPEMRSTLDTVVFLRGQKRKFEEELGGGCGADGEEDDEADDEETNERNEKGVLKTTFPLSETLYAHAMIPIHTPTTKLDSVYLWLGANVMASYPLEDAEVLLRSKLEKAKESLKANEEDLEFLRVQITTVEVAMARVWNWDVGEKRKRRKEEAAEGGGGRPGKGDDDG